MNRGVLIGLTIGVGAIALGAVLWMRGESPAVSGLQQSASSSSPSSSSAQSPTAASPMPGAGPDGTVPGAAAPGAPGTGAAGSSLPPGRLPGQTEAAAPWMVPSDGARTPASGEAPAVRAGREGAPTLDQIQQRLQNLLASPQPDVREVDAVLADLQKNQGSKVVAGVDLQAVRDNLARSERIRQIAVEMQALAAKPGPEVPAQLQARMAEIQRLQAGMNASVAAPAASAGANR